MKYFILLGIIVFQFSIGNAYAIEPKVVAIFKDNTNGQQTKKGLLDAYQNISGLSLEIVMIPNDKSMSEEVTKIFWLDNNGYVDIPLAQDENVVAIVVTNTSSVFAAESKSFKEKPLILATNATTTTLDLFPNVLILPPNNKTQASGFFINLTYLASRKMFRYATIVNIDKDSDFYSHELYFQTLQRTLHAEADHVFKSEETFSQGLATLFFSGKDDDIDKINRQLTELKVDGALCLGCGDSLKKFYQKNPALTWIASDYTYDFKDFKGGDVFMYNYGGTLQAYGFDAGGFIKTVLSEFSGKEFTRKSFLEMAKTVEYQGHTGLKSFQDGSNPLGWYDILHSGEDDWDFVAQIANY
jgi:hypothetical protein